ncbi:hypothetical protein [Pajaroellobacter abortibovis]|uniref:Uncharacterized protein n=1 Tax=Pajaroellobacter abortibovis TaxID=1882918 RepID=A0A1L6MVD6_9BACT|nr:hypothetical protein [Pajaroellobacter abortibovis]APR99482.1 hypothetical protein BCY86_01390 [Pajaroellobacter abortibovis]
MSDQTRLLNGQGMAGLYEIHYQIEEGATSEVYKVIQIQKLLSFSKSCDSLPRVEWIQSPASKEKLELLHNSLSLRLSLIERWHGK